MNMEKEHVSDIDILSEMFMRKHYEDAAVVQGKTYEEFLEELESLKCEKIDE